MKALILFASLFVLFIPKIGNAQDSSLPAVGTSVLLEHEGETVFANFSTSQEVNGGINLFFNQQRYLSPYNYSPRTIRVAQAQAQFQTEVPSIEHQMHNETRSLEPGQVVLTRDNKVYVIRAVFSDGQIAVHPVRGTLMNRDGLGVGGRFAVPRGSNAEIINREQIVALAVDSFRGYKISTRASDTIPDIEGIPLCDRDRIQSFNFPSHVRREFFPVSGCRVNREAPVISIFSNGTFYFGTDQHGENLLMNPFPSTINQYRNTDPNAAQ